MMADTPPTSPPPNPKQGWPSVPSPKGSPDKGGRSPVDAGVRADLAARRRVVVSPRSAALLKQAANKKRNKFVPGPLPNQLAPAFKVSNQCLSEPAPGPSPNGKGKWRPKPRVGAAAGRRRHILKLNAALGRSAGENGSASGSDNSGAASSNEGEGNANASGTGAGTSDAGGGASDAGSGASDAGGRGVGGASDSSPVVVATPTEKEPKQPGTKTLETMTKRFTCALYDEASNSWSCKRCTEVQVQCPFATGIKIDPFRVSARFTKHCGTKVHKDALDAIKDKAEGSLKATAEKIGMKRERAARPSRKPHIRTAASLGQLGSAASHFPAQLRAVEDSANDLGATTPLDPTNRDENAAAAIMRELHWNLFEKLLERLAHARVICVSLDESTDVSTKEMLVVYLSWVDEMGVPHVEFVWLPCMMGTSATNIYGTIKTLLKKHGLCDKLVALGSDGASVMTGKGEGRWREAAWGRRVPACDALCVPQARARCERRCRSRLVLGRDRQAAYGNRPTGAQVGQAARTFRGDREAL